METLLKASHQQIIDRVVERICRVPDDVQDNNNSSTHADGVHCESVECGHHPEEESSGIINLKGLVQEIFSDDQGVPKNASGEEGATRVVLRCAVDTLDTPDVNVWENLDLTRTTLTSKRLEDLAAEKGLVVLPLLEDGTWGSDPQLEQRQFCLTTEPSEKARFILCLFFYFTFVQLISFLISFMFKLHFAPLVTVSGNAAFLGESGACTNSCWEF